MVSREKWPAAFVEATGVKILVQSFFVVGNNKDNLWN